MSVDQLPLVLAQAIPMPFDLQLLLTQGPLGVAVAWLMWQNARKDDKIEKMETAHRTELAAERALYARVIEERFADQKVLIPLASSMSVVTEQAADVLRDVARR